MKIYPIISHEHSITSLRTSYTSQTSFDICDEMSSKIFAFQRKHGNWITENCQHIQSSDVHFYGIHKDAQMQTRDSFATTVQATRRLYQETKSHVLQNVGLPSTTVAIQIVGSSPSFSLKGTEKAKAFLHSQITKDNLVIFGFNGYADSDGARSANACVTDVVLEKGMQNQTVANLVGYHTPLALKEWGCTGSNALKHYVIVYSDDETNAEKGTLFGDDITTSDFMADKLLILVGGVQSFREACNALLLGQNIVALAGLNSPSNAFAKEVITDVHGKPREVLTPYFSAAQFLKDIVTHLSDKGTSEIELQNWYNNYFGRGKCYVSDPRKGDFSARKKLMDNAWDFFIKEKLYLKIQRLCSFE